MKIEEQKATVAGHQLHRLILHPAEAPRGTLVFFHGQGDFIDRYPAILSPFVEAGFRCVLNDLPGHGRSEGTRGHIPGLPLIDALLDDSLEGQPEPHLIGGHSMGGLMALRLLLNQPDRFAAAWFSSPLLDPMRQAKPWMRATLPLIARILPRITISTGVRSDDCTDDDNRRPDDAQDVLYHSSISLSWGLALRAAATNVAKQFPNFPSHIPTLFTQGKLDNVCPASILKERLGNVNTRKITYCEIATARHEPFSGSTLDEFLKAIRDWLSEPSQKQLR